jgi:hypothetical protein
MPQHRRVLHDITWHSTANMRSMLTSSHLDHVVPEGDEEVLHAPCRIREKPKEKFAPHGHATRSDNNKRDYESS